MLTVRFITVGTLKEAYLKEAVAEYQKRLSGFCKVEEVNLKESRLSDRPSSAEIKTALESEGKSILQAVPPRSYAIAMCVEGETLSSEELAARLDKVCHTAGHICFIIGSSYGLSPEVKAACPMRLSVSRLTFPHQLMRVILCETVYRCFNILKGTQYHK